MFKQWLSLQQAYTSPLQPLWALDSSLYRAKQTLSTLCSGVKYRDTRKIYYICSTVALQVVGAVSAAGPQKNHLRTRLCGLGSLRCAYAQAMGMPLLHCRHSGARLRLPRGNVRSRDQHVSRPSHMYFNLLVPWSIAPTVAVRHAVQSRVNFSSAVQGGGALSCCLIQSRAKFTQLLALRYM